MRGYPKVTRTTGDLGAARIATGEQLASVLLAGENRAKSWTDDPLPGSYETALLPCLSLNRGPGGGGV